MAGRTGSRLRTGAPVVRDSLGDARDSLGDAADNEFGALLRCPVGVEGESACRRSDRLDHQRDEWIELAGAYT
jgi:hypothetical protein